MTREDIVQQVFQETNLTKTECKSSVETLIDILKSTLSSRESVKVSGFGKFRVVERKERMGRNPKTGESALIKQGHSVRFSPGKSLWEAVNK